MPPLIAREEALGLSERTDHAEIEALVERASRAQLRFAKKSAVPRRPDGAANRSPTG